MAEGSLSGCLEGSSTSQFLTESVASPTVKIKSPDSAKSISLKRENVTLTILSKVFNLNPGTIFLLSGDGDIACPSESGSFTDVNTSVCEWQCLGDNLEGSSSSFYTNQPDHMKYVYQAPFTPPPTSSQYHSDPSWPCTSLSRKGKQPMSGKSFWKSSRKPPGASATDKEIEWLKQVDMFKWNDDAWEKIPLNLPVKLTEQSANVSSVCQMVSRDGFEGKEVVLLDVEFRRIVDIPSTKGSAFWKGGRKIRGVLKEDYLYSQENFKAKKSKTIDLSGSLSTSDKLLLAQADVTSLKVKVSCLKGTIKSISDYFKCVICMRVLGFPLFMSPCCKVILGCHSCVTPWVEDNQTCPHCRSPLQVGDLINYPEIRSLTATILASISD